MKPHVPDTYLVNGLREKWHDDRIYALRQKLHLDTSWSSEAQSMLEWLLEDRSRRVAKAISGFSANSNLSSDSKRPRHASPVTCNMGDPSELLSVPGDPSPHESSSNVSGLAVSPCEREPTTPIRSVITPTTPIQAIAPRISATLDPNVLVGVTETAVRALAHVAMARIEATPEHRCEMTSVHGAPGYQGYWGTCTYWTFAAVVSAALAFKYERRIPTQLMYSEIKNVIKGFAKSKWPEDMPALIHQGGRLLVLETEKEQLHVRTHVTKLGSFEETCKRVHKAAGYPHVMIVMRKDLLSKNTHAMQAFRWNRSSETICCNNTHGDAVDPYPRVSRQEFYAGYSVSVSIVEAYTAGHGGKERQAMEKLPDISREWSYVYGE